MSLLECCDHRKALEAENAQLKSNVRRVVSHISFCEALMRTGQHEVVNIHMLRRWREKLCKNIKLGLPSDINVAKGEDQ